jgi:hypothetical protein
LDFKDLHRKARESATVALHQFLYDFKPQLRSVFAFFEGENDESFYMNFIDRHLCDDLSVFRYQCGGKSGVYYLRKMVDPKILGHQASLYFVDRDLTPFIGSKAQDFVNVYITDLYSIENEVVHTYILERMLREIYHLVLDQDTLTRLKKDFEAQLRYFHKRMRWVMAWMIIQMNNNKKVMKNDFRLQHVIPPDYPKTKGTVAAINAELHRITKDPCPVTKLELRPVLRKLRSSTNAKQYVRGKYEAWFMVRFLKSTLAILASGGLVTNCNLNLTQKNLIDQAGPRCRCPESLTIFLTRNLLAGALP